jgi:two-component system chemotaxis response regulator CheB
VVVGSQGALDSFKEMLGPLTPRFPASVIFDLHRSGRYDVIEQVLERRTGLHVEVAREGTAPRPGQIYVAPADRQLVISGERRFGLLEPSDGVGHRFADLLLKSAAEAFGPRLIAVVLSGRLNGGANGVRHVKRRGGRVLVEHPDSAVAASMPNAALATGCVDFGLRPDRIGQVLIALCAAIGAADLFRVRVNAAIAS